MNLKDMFIAMGEGLGSDMSRQRLDQKIEEADLEIETALSYGDFDLADVIAEKAIEDGIDINECYKEDPGYVYYKEVCRLEHQADEWQESQREDKI
jgi:hypothetical protein